MLYIQYISFHINFFLFCRFRPIKESNVGHKLLKKMGWSEGESLGKDNTGIQDPVSTVKRVYSNTSVIRFPVLSNVDFHALLTIFYVFYTEYPTSCLFQNSACWIRQISVYIHVMYCTTLYWCRNSHHNSGV